MAAEGGMIAEGARGVALGQGALSRRRAARAAATEASLTYPYLGSEMRRIGAIAALMAVIMAIMTLVLR